jgi:hypothetical protein
MIVYELINAMATSLLPEVKRNELKSSTKGVDNGKINILHAQEV